MDNGAYGIEISGNTITSVHWGIYLHNAYDMKITGNTSYNNTMQFYARHDKNNHPVTDITFTENNLIAQKNNQIIMSLYSSTHDIKDFGIFTNNFYTPLNKKNMIYVEYKIADQLIKERPTLQNLQDKYGFEKESLYQNESLQVHTDVKVLTNSTTKQKTFLLDQPYTDIKKQVYKKSIDVPAYSSIVLLKK